MLNSATYAARFTRILALFLATSVLPVLNANAQKAEQDVQRFKDWAVVCGKAKGADGAETDRCAMVQQASKDGKPVVQVEMFPDDKKKYKLIGVMTTPLGTVLTPGLGVRVDEGDEKRVPFRVCLPVGCRAVLPANDALVKTMKKGKKLHVSFVLPTGQSGTAHFSLQGFTAAMRAVTK